MWGNRILVRFLFLKTRTEAKRSNPKFRFLWLFSKPNLSHTNSQYLSHSHKAFTFFTLRTLSDSKWSWNQIIGSTPNEHLENRRPKCKCTHKKDSLHVFLYFTTDLQRIPNRQFFKTEPTVFLKTEPNLKNPFHTSLLASSEKLTARELKTIKQDRSPATTYSAAIEMHLF